MNKKDLLSQIDKLIKVVEDERCLINLRKLEKEICKFIKSKISAGVYGDSINTELILDHVFGEHISPHSYIRSNFNDFDDMIDYLKKNKLEERYVFDAKGFAIYLLEHKMGLSQKRETK